MTGHIEDHALAPIRGTGSDRAAFVKRLQTILAHWPSADRLAREMKVSPSAFRKWLKGEAEPSRERLVALARAAGVGIAWLAEGAGDKPVFELVSNTRRRPASASPDEPFDWSRFVLLPRRPEAAAAGSQTPAAPQGTEYLALRRDWIASELGMEPDRLLLERAEGDSMSPTIKHDSVMLVDTGDTAFGTFGIFVVEIDGERLVKRVQRKHDGSLVLISDNAAYHPDLVAGANVDRVVVIGRVVWVGNAL